MRVRKLATEQVWRRRYEHIRNFERLLTDEGTTVVKVFLHLSRDEQRVRLQERLDDPEKRWKFRLGDLDDRAHWDEFARSLRGRAPRDLDRVGALVRRPRRPQLVAQPRRRRDPASPPSNGSIPGPRARPGLDDLEIA